MSTKKYETWPALLEKAAKKQRKLNHKRASASAYCPNGDAAAAASLDKIVLDEVSTAITKHLNLSLHLTEQDGFLMEMIPNLLIMLSDTNTTIPESLRNIPIPSREDEGSIEEQLQSHVFTIADSIHLDPFNWPMLIQISFMIISQWSPVLGINENEKVKIIVQVVKTIIGMLWVSAIFPHSAMVQLCLFTLVELYVGMKRKDSSSSSSRGIFSCCCMTQQQTEYASAELAIKSI